MNRREAMKAALAASTLAALPAAAQNLDRPVRFIVPFAPGGTSDILARLLSTELTKSFGQNVVVENRTGASGNIGADLVAKSAPDGHTMLIIDVSTLATAPSLYTRFPFDLKRDLAPVTMLIYAPYILAVHPSVPVNNAAELVAYAKANPAKVNVGHAGIGVGNHLTGLLVTQHWGADLTQVPYRGGADGRCLRRSAVDHQWCHRHRALLQARPVTPHRRHRPAPPAGFPRCAHLQGIGLAGGRKRHLARRAGAGRHPTRHGGTAIARFARGHGGAKCGGTHHHHWRRKPRRRPGILPPLAGQ